jgi:hypothetical protein
MRFILKHNRKRWANGSLGVHGKYGLNRAILRR